LLRTVREQAFRLSHPHLLTPYSWAADDDEVLIAMDLIRGGSLGTLLGDYGRLPAACAAVILDQLLAAILIRCPVASWDSMGAESPSTAAIRAWVRPSCSPTRASSVPSGPCHPTRLHYRERYGSRSRLTSMRRSAAFRSA
jgi:hypothetical protein